MLATNAYHIRFATAADADTLTRLAERDSQGPLAGRVLIGRYDGTAAALSLDDGRVIADRSAHGNQLVAALRIRAGAIEAFEATPSLADRLRAAFASYNRGATPLPAVSGDGHPEEEDLPIAA